MKLALLLLIVCANPSPAQFRSVSIAVRGVGCASCMESLPERLRRVRGVESAEVNENKDTVTLRLAARNRVRLEQIRDFIEQDGTKAVKATVEVSGAVTRTEGVWILDPAGLNTQYQLEGTQPDLIPGTKIVQGDVPDLHPASGRVTIRVSRMD